MAQHSWEENPDELEGDARPSNLRHAWESPTPCSSDSSDSDSETGNNDSDPAKQLLAFCTDLYLVKSLTARDFCTIMHWCNQCGIHQAAPLAFRPNAPSGHYQRHLNATLPVFTANKDCLYKLDIPSFDKDEDVLQQHEFSMVPGHEVIAEAFAADATMRVKLDEAVSLRELPSTYWDHPVVTSAPVGTSVLPISLFVDGVPYSQTD